MPVLGGVDITEGDPGRGELVIDVINEGLKVRSHSVRDEDLLPLAFKLVQLSAHGHNFGLGLLHQLRPPRHADCGCFNFQLLEVC